MNPIQFSGIHAKRQRFRRNHKFFNSFSLERDIYAQKHPYLYATGDERKELRKNPDNEYLKNQFATRFLTTTYPDYRP